ncbi:MAG: MATE family efflux transporter [Eubacterium sp.]|nr:MATE family efflux transporter [Eubacterium sp.]
MDSTNEVIKENKMGVMPVNPLLISMALPIMISMLVQALYNIVDSMFVSMVSENALTAVSLAFPIQNLMIAIATGTGVGINALLSKSLGAKDYAEANRAANNGVFLAVLSTLVFVLFGIFFTGAFFETQTSDPEILAHGKAYLTVCCVLSIGVFGQITFERLLQATGRTILTMITQGTGAIINIILDPIMIFGLFGFPELGVAGAALATVIGQIVAMIIALILNIKLNHEITLSIKGFKPHKHTIGRIYAVGVPSIIMTSITSVMTFFMNNILMSFTSTATAVFGIYIKLQSFVFMPIFGLNNGMVPIIAYNYGAQKKHRITQTIRLSITYAILIMLIGFCLCQFIPDKLLSIFSASQDMLAIGNTALRIISISFLFAGFCIVCSSVFQALGNGVLSLLVSVARQLVVLIPAAFLLAQTGNLSAIWWAFPIAEVASLVCSALFLRHIYKQKVKPLPDLA